MRSSRGARFLTEKLKEFRKNVHNSVGFLSLEKADDFLKIRKFLLNRQQPVCLKKRP